MSVSYGRMTLLGFSCLVLGTLSLNQEGLAHDQPKQCGAIKDGDGDPVLQSDGDIVLYAGSGPCPEEIAAPAEPLAPITATILFNFDVATPNAEGQSALDALIDELIANAPDAVSVAGHADRAGSEAYNDRLSSERAENVAEALIAAGIPADSVSTDAFGESSPAIPTEDGVREPANRRAEVEASFE